MNNAAEFNRDVLALRDKVHELLKGHNMAVAILACADMVGHGLEAVPQGMLRDFLTAKAHRLIFERDALMAELGAPHEPGQKH